MKILNAKVLNHMLYMEKQPNIDINSTSMMFSKSMYNMKRNNTGPS